MKLKLLLLILLILISCKKESLQQNVYSNKHDNNQTEKKIEKGVFLKPEKIKILGIDKIPELTLKIFGIGGMPPDIPETNKKLIYFSNEDSAIYLLNYNIPDKKMNVQLINPEGIIYNKDYFKNKNEITILEENDMGEKYKNPVIVISINNQAYLTSGNWKASIKIDNNSTLNSYFNLVASPVSILNHKKTNPLLVPEEKQIYSIGDTLYVFGNYKLPNTEILFGFYQFTDKLTDDFETIMEPQLGIKIKTDNYGRFNFAYKIGNDLPDGQYRIAYGKELSHIHLFEGYFQIK